MFNDLSSSDLAMSAHYTNQYTVQNINLSDKKYSYNNINVKALLSLATSKFKPPPPYEQ